MNYYIAYWIFNKSDGNIDLEKIEGKIYLLKFKAEAINIASKSREFCDKTLHEHLHILYILKYFLSNAGFQ